MEDAHSKCTTGGNLDAKGAQWHSGKLGSANPKHLKGTAMLHSHLTMEERIGIAVFMHMGMSCRKIAAYTGRGHTFIFQEAAP